MKVVQGLPELVLGGLQLGLHGHVNLVQVLVLRTEDFIKMVVFVITLYYRGFHEKGSLCYLCALGIDK